MNTIDSAPAREVGHRDEEIQNDPPAGELHSPSASYRVQSADPLNFELKDLFEATPGESGKFAYASEQHHSEWSGRAQSPAASVDRSQAPMELVAEAESKSRPGVVDHVSFDETYVANLDERMSKSGLEERGWRDRQDLDDVMRDLERLASADWRKAATLWDKYRQGDEDKPIFIDGDDKDPPTLDATAKRGGGKQVETSHQETSNAQSARAVAKLESADDVAVIPNTLVKRYLVADNKFYFRDDPNLLAFEDKGKRLSTEHNDPQVAKSMVELAEAKRWNSLKVKGSEEFRREVWRFASLRGLEVQGYQPSDVEKAELAERMKELNVRTANSIEQGSDREKAQPRAAKSLQPEAGAKDRPMVATSDATQEARINLTKPQKIAVDTLRAILTERGDSAKAVEMAAQLASQRFQQQRVYVGRLIAHGSAPYNNQPNEKPNYFVTLNTINGERTVWGVDLERAMTAEGVKTGDDLAVVARGKKRVKVAAHERDAAGTPTGRQIDTEVERNTWEVGKLDKMREEARERISRAAQQSERNEPSVPIYDTKTKANPVPVDVAKQRSPEPARGR